MPIISFFLKLLLPFLNEAFFGNGSIKDWAKRNIATGIWLLLILLMLGAVLRLSFLLNAANSDLWHLKQTNQSLIQDKQHSLNIYLTSIREHNREIANLKASLTWLQTHCILIPPVEPPAKPTKSVPTKTKSFPSS